MRSLLLTIIFAFCIFSISSCGPSASEKAQIQQQHDDSIKNAIEHKYEIGNEFKTDNEKLKKLRFQMENEKASLEVENAKMNDLKGFKFLRTANEKAQQIKNKSLKIQSIQDNISTMEQNITQVQDKISSLKSELQNFQ